MKYLLILALAALPPASQAAECAFGETTGDLRDHFELPLGERTWFRGEDLSLSNEQRLNGLNDAEKEMILLASGIELSDLAGFSGDDGYITYFGHNSDRREFAIVASYPGDNEYGAIVQVTNPGRKDMKIVGVVAKIGDGDFFDCKVSE